ncbi:MAG TPA: radical SAM protein [Anaerolineaceae bacterium]|nr:radical SAM protein [Anaerolineaceae bacterium]HPN52623.1 radical SAM protein [Anaerolineaceae bacterium]
MEVKKRKLVLVNPVNPARTGLTVNKSSRFPPISLGIVAALTPDSWDVEIVDENWEAFTFRQADLVGITAFTASAPRAYEIAAVYRQRGIPVVMGGIHCSMCPQEALNHVDAVVIGEAEGVWVQVIADFEASALQREYRGGWNDLNTMPRPRRDLFHPDYIFASVQTSRGCPLNCEFCSVTAFNGQRYRRRPTDEILAELETIPQKMLFFVDDNIIGYGQEARQAALELFKGMVERKFDKWWFCQASINFADDDEILSWAAKAGCKMVFLGLEAEETEALQEVEKRLNLQRGVDAYSQAFERIHHAGIAVLGAFIFGMDNDTPQRLKQRTDYMIRQGVDVMQVTYLTPLPGTRLFERYLTENRLLYANFPQDWQHYDMTEVVYHPGSMSSDELTDCLQLANAEMYSWPVLMRKAFRTFLSTHDPMATMFAWSSNQNYRQVSHRV